MNTKRSYLNFVHFSISLFAVCVFLLLFGKTASFAENKPVITVTPRFETAEIGDTVTFDYEITGIDECHQLEAWLLCTREEGTGTWTGIQCKGLNSMSGSFSFTVKNGYAVKGRIQLIAPDDLPYNGESVSIPVTGYVPLKPVITVTPRFETAEIGDTVTFDYEITGIDECRQLEAFLICARDEDMGTWIGVQGKGLNSMSGSFTFTVKNGYAVKGRIQLIGPDGLSYNGESVSIPVTGYVPLKPVITVTPRFETAEIGDTVTFDYVITGIDECRQIEAYLICARDEDMSTWIGVQGKGLNSMSGSFSFTVKYGYAVKGRIQLIGPDDLPYNGESVAVPLVASAIYLPSDLERIEAGAFIDSAAKNIYIPNRVNSIEQGAFPEGVTIYAQEGSFAAQWAALNGFTLITSW